MNTQTSTRLAPTPEKPVAPLAPFPVVLLVFAATSAVFFLFLYAVLPLLVRSGTSWFVIFNVVLVVPMALLLVATLVACRREGLPITWPALRDRLRLGRPDAATWMWTLALSAFMYGGRWSFAVAFFSAVAAVTIEHRGVIRPQLAGIGGVTLYLAASWLLWQAGPWLQPIQLHARPETLGAFLSGFGTSEFMGTPLQGQWWMAVYYLAVLVLFNVAGEELWWRGYLLPRQEVVSGSRAWIVHGLLWAAFHLFFLFTLWDLVRMIPTCCALAFVVQHRRNTWPGLVAHTFGNSGLLIQIVQGVTG